MLKILNQVGIKSFYNPWPRNFKDALRDKVAELKVVYPVFYVLVIDVIQMA